jgi:tetratricopeptide (TPR) repeat protein
MERMDLERHFGHLSEAVAIGEHLITQLESTPGLDPHHLAVAYRRRATIMWVVGRYTTAVADLQQSIGLFNNTGDILSATFSEGNLGLVYYSMAQYDRAESSKLHAIRVAEDLNAGWWLVREVGEMCAIYMARGELARALSFCRRHIELAKQFNDATQLGIASSNRSVTLLLLGRFDEAGLDIETAFHNFHEQDRVESIIAGTIDMTLFLRGTGQMDKASRLAEENYKRAFSYQFPVLQLLTTRCLALFRSATEQEILLRQALSLATSLDRRLDIAGCMFSLSVVVSNANEQNALYEQAVEMLNQMGAKSWLDGHSMKNPPLLPLFL